MEIWFVIILFISFGFLLASLILVVIQLNECMGLKIKKWFGNRFLKLSLLIKKVRARHFESYFFVLLVALIFTTLLILIAPKWTRYVVNNLMFQLVDSTNSNNSDTTYILKHNNSLASGNKFGNASDTLGAIVSNSISNTYSSSDTGARGDAFGGTLAPLIGWLAAVLTFLAFWAQYKANKQQREDLQKERFEARFFKFIDYHRDNVAQMKYADPKRTGDGQKLNNENNGKKDK